MRQGDRHVGAGAGPDDEHVLRDEGHVAVGLVVEGLLLQAGRRGRQPLMGDPVDVDLPLRATVAVVLLERA